MVSEQLVRPAKSSSRCVGVRPTVVFWVLTIVWIAGTPKVSIGKWTSGDLPTSDVCSIVYSVCGLCFLVVVLVVDFPCCVFLKWFTLLPVTLQCVLRFENRMRCKIIWWTILSYCCTNNCRSVLITANENIFIECYNFDLNSFWKRPQFAVTILAEDYRLMWLLFWLA